MEFKKVNSIISIVVFVISFFTYYLTVEPTVSLWDCGEYLASSYKLSIGHPPGAPLFSLIGRLFSSFTGPEKAAFMINLTSVVSSALTIFFLYLSIILIGKKLIDKNNKSEYSFGDKIALFGSGIVGALAYNFSDTFWFSAVEGEVYAMSSFFTALVFWAVLKWDENHQDSHSDRWIILIWFLIGLSMGVHLLNLLVIPAASYIFYFRKYSKINIKGLLLTGAISIAILAFINYGFVSILLRLLSGFERFFTNSIGLPFNFGSFIFVIVVFGTISYFILNAKKSNKRLNHTILSSLAMLLLGFSIFTVILVRSNSNPPLDENDPETIPQLSSYLAREQYGETPLITGPYWNSFRNSVNPNEIDKHSYFRAYILNHNGKEESFKTEYDAKEYMKENNIPNSSLETKYVIAKTSFKDAEIPLDKKGEFTFLPRMYWTGDGKQNGYVFWSGYDPNDGNHTVQASAPIMGGDVYIPTMKENLNYLFNYQIGWMYFRYFLWNFAGKQNDIQGHGYANDEGTLNTGSLSKGNWLSGINFIDNTRLGKQEKLPVALTYHESYNKYFFLPLILGLIGLFFHLIKNPKDAFSVLLLFFFTGLAIIMYLNQKPQEPRERDYAYAASFYAFSIWIGLSVIALYQWSKTAKINFKTLEFKIIGAVVGICILFDFALHGSITAFSLSILFIAIVALLLMGLFFLINKSNNKSLSAILSFALAMVAPILMGMENWNDHDRSDRYFARQLAQAYLHSCGKNAILMCFGDNDTFPLWYAQEVEGDREDMKVMNYQLLAADWHINQLNRATYKAPAFKTKMEERHYRTGRNDALFLNGTVDLTMTAEEFIDNIINGKYFHPQYSTLGYGAIPAKSITLTKKVDKAAGIKNGIFDAKDSANILNEISWTISGNVVKNDLALIDMLASYKWDREICFTSPGIQSANKGLGQFLRQNGFISKLEPLSNRLMDIDKNYEYFTGNGYDFDKDGKKEKIDFLNLGSGDVLIDYHVERSIQSFRGGYLNFINSAYNELQYTNRSLATDSNNTALKQKAEKLKMQIKTSAVKVLEGTNVKYCKYNEYVNGFVRFLYLINEDKLADKYANQLIEIFKSSLDYYAIQDEKYTSEMISEIGKIIQYMDELSSFAKSRSLVDQYTTKKDNTGKDQNRVLNIQGKPYNVPIFELNKNPTVKDKFKLEKYYKEIYPKIASNINLAMMLPNSNLQSNLLQDMTKQDNFIIPNQFKTIFLFK